MTHKGGREVRLGRHLATSTLKSQCFVSFTERNQGIPVSEVGDFGLECKAWIPMLINDERNHIHSDKAILFSSFCIDKHWNSGGLLRITNRDIGQATSGELVTGKMRGGK